MKQHQATNCSGQPILREADNHSMSEHSCSNEPVLGRLKLTMESTVLHHQTSCSQQLDIHSKKVVRTARSRSSSRTNRVRGIKLEVGASKARLHDRQAECRQDCSSTEVTTSQNVGIVNEHKSSKLNHNTQIIN